MSVNSTIKSIESECRRYKALAEGAIAQLDETELTAAGSGGDNSVAVIVWHLAGNLASRFTDFLTTDGEKPWRHRDEEFAERSVSHPELMEKWEHGWGILFGTLSELREDQLMATVTIRSQPLLVHEALHRSLAHVSYHVGQIVYIARSARGADWRFLSIPPGGTEAYNQNPTFEKATEHTRELNRSDDGE